MRLRAALLLTAVLAWAGTCRAADSPPFELVLIDAAGEQRLGGFPIDRALMARVVTRLHAAGAKAVVLKFFYDQPGDAKADAALAAATRSGKTLLQARIDDEEPHPNPLPARFTAGAVCSCTRAAVTGRSGWLPLPALADAAFDLGFVDGSEPDRLPMIELYAGKPVRSLLLATLELAAGEKAVIDDGKRLRLGARSLPLTADNQAVWRVGPKDDQSLRYTSFTTLLNGEPDRAKFAGKIVVIAYDGVKMHSIHTDAGEIKAHRLFYLGLTDLWQQLH